MSPKPHTRHRKILLPIPSSLFFLVSISTFYIGKWIDSIIITPSFPPFPFNYSMGPMVMAVGTIPAFTSVRTLYKVGQGVPLGDLCQSAQSKYLLTSGIYVYNRNPMLSGYPLSLNGLDLVSQPPSIAFPQPLLNTAIWTV
jgi:protein-S-isoprenylcysteine O-methyltransferase Ste14